MKSYAYYISHHHSELRRALLDAAAESIAEEGPAALILRFFFLRDGDHRDLHVDCHSFPTRRSSDLRQQFVQDDAGRVLVRRGLRLALLALRLLGDRKSTRLNSSHQSTSRMPSSA